MKAYKKLDWAPKITLEELISEMVDCDMKEAKNEILLSKKL